MKKGLIMEGGAMRGLFTAGVIDVMMENEIKFDAAIGVSAGAAFGCNYKSGQIGRVIRYKERFIRDKRYCGVGILLKTKNYYNTDFCYGDVPLKYDVFDFDAYEKNSMDFYVVCTDIETGEAVYHKFLGRGDHEFDWIRASASMPLVSEIVDIDGQKLLDGGIADSIPIEYFQKTGYEKNVLILTRPKTYRKEKNPLMPLIRIKYKKYPKLICALEKRHEEYNRVLELIEKEEKQGNIFVIRPDDEIPLSHTERNPKKLRNAYEIGRKKADSVISDMIKFLEN